MSLTWRTGSRRLRAPHVSCLSNADNALVSPHQSFNRQCSNSSKSYFLSFLVARTKHNYLCLQYCNSIVLAVFYSILYLNAIQYVCWCISMFHCIGRLAHWHNPIQSNPERTCIWRQRSHQNKTRVRTSHVRLIDQTRVWLLHASILIVSVFSLFIFTCISIHK